MIQWRTFLSICITFIFFAILEGSIWDSSGFFESCNVDRYNPNFKETTWGNSFLSKLIFNFTQLCLLVLFVDLILFEQSHHSGNANSLQKEKTNLQQQQNQSVPSTTISRVGSFCNRWGINEKSVFLVSFCIGWWLSTHAIIDTLKVLLGDSQCHNGSPNSVSGHYGFHIFFIFSALYLMVYTKRDPREIRHYFTLKPFFSKQTTTKRMILAYVFLVISSCITLSRTWLLGYHTGKQILLGSLVAVLSHLLFTYVLEHASQKAVYAIISFSSFSILILWHFAGRHPFTVLELFLFPAVLIIAFLTYKLEHLKVPQLTTSIVNQENNPSSKQSGNFEERQLLSDPLGSENQT